MKLSKEEKDKLYAEVYNYKTESELGFTGEEIEDVKSKYSGINENKFDDAMMGNTCGMIRGKLRIYPTDVYHAILVGLENRNLSVEEWD